MRLGKLPVDVNDLVAAVGLVLLGAGLWLWWPPAALMVVGGLLVVLALIRAVRRGVE